MSDHPDGPFPPLEVVEPPVRFVRRVSLRDGGAVVECRLTSTAAEPTAVTIRHPLPRGLGIEDTGFRPDADPDDWEYVDGSVVAAVRVPPDEERRLVFGVSVSEGSAIPESLPDPEIVVEGRTNSQDGADGQDGTRGQDSGGPSTADPTTSEFTGADPKTLEEAVQRVEAGEAPELGPGGHDGPGMDLRDGGPPEREDTATDDDSGTVTLSEEDIARRNEELMWLRARAVVAEREREELRAAVEQLSEALASVDGVARADLPDLDGDDDG